MTKFTTADTSTARVKLVITDTSAYMEPPTTDEPTKDTPAMDTTTIDHSTLEESTARLRSRIAVCEAVTGYSFRDWHLCAEALNRLDGDAALVLEDGQPVRLPKNDRLAVYGDVVATAELCRAWSEQPGASTADWPEIKADLLGDSYLNEWGRIHGISDCVFMEPGRKEPEDEVVVLTTQAVLGAVYKDGGRAPLYRVMRRLNLLNHAALGGPHKAENLTL